MKVISTGTDRKIFEEGSAVRLRTLDYASKTEEFHVIVFTLQSEGLKYKKIDNLHLYPTNSKTEWLYVLNALFIGFKILRSLRQSRNDLVVSTQDPFQTGFVGLVLSKIFRLPLQIQIHTDFLSEHFSNTFFNRVRAVLANISIPQASGLRTVNSVIAHSVIKRYQNLKSVPEVLPIFVDVEKIIADDSPLPINLPKFDNTLLMASRLTTEKRIDLALDVVKKITAKFPNTGLVIAGDGSEKVNLENKINLLGLSNNVVFIGWQNNLIPFYKSADVFLLTSEFEGYGMTLIEAGASGVPIVTTRVGIAKTDLFRNSENSFVCPVGDSQCLEKSIIDLIENVEMRKLFKERMQDSIRKTAFSKDEYTARYIGLLASLLK